MSNTINIPILADQIYSSFKMSVLTAVSNAVPQLKAVATTYVVDEEKLLKDLGIQFLSGQIDETFLLERLKETEEDLENALISVEQISASIIQKLVTNLIGLFSNLLIATLSTLNAA